MKTQSKAYIYALLAVAFWSTIATAFSLALNELDVFQLMTGASFVAVICLTIILKIQGNLGFLTKLKSKDLLHSAGLGFLNPFLYYVVLLKAYTILPAQEAMALNYMWPISLVLLSVVILKQKISWKSLLSILISFIGVIVIGTRGKLLDFTFTDWYGDLLAIGSSVIWALFWIFNMKDKRNESEKLFLNFFFGFFYLLIGTLFFSEFKIPEANGVFAVVYIGLFELGITFFLWMKALSFSSSTDKVSQLAFLSPFL
ncbi:MAG: EamA family transporter, partial [Bacteroidota bacterium]|nr:EamA family transporter [Bacteroidota bacterium]